MNNQKMTVNINQLKLSQHQLFDIRDCLCQKVIDGLRTHNTEIMMLPTYIRRPQKRLYGNAVVMDIGGTNIRVALIKLNGRRINLISGPFKDQETMQKGKVNQINARQFFSTQADLISRVCSETEISLGYCFSYPTEMRAIDDATLIRWTKGVNIPNVVGEQLKLQIHDTLYEKNIKLIDFAILNDTVASLLTGEWISKDCTHHIGLIVGTGTNMAGFFPVRSISKLAPHERKDWHEDEDMAINLESGNFSPPHLTEYDDMIDIAKPGDNSGFQRFEKAVSGAYLPRLFGYIVGRKNCLQLPNGFDPEDPDAHPGLIARFMDYPGLVGEAATVLLNRSADLVAAALAGLIQAYDQRQKKVGILAEGAMFWQTPGYCMRVKNTLSSLVLRGTVFKILRGSSAIDSNLLGATLAVLSVKKSNQLVSLNLSFSKFS